MELTLREKQYMVTSIINSFSVAVNRTDEKFVQHALFSNIEMMCYLLRDDMAFVKETLVELYKIKILLVEPDKFMKVIEGALERATHLFTHINKVESLVSALSRKKMQMSQEEGSDQDANEH